MGKKIMKKYQRLSSTFSNIMGLLFIASLFLTSLCCVSCSEEESSSKSSYPGTPDIPGELENLITRSDIEARVTGNTYYLNAASGNDNNDGLSSGSSWRTIDKAQSVVSGGDCVKISDGNYGAFVGDNNYSENVIYMAGSGQTPTFTQIKIRNNKTSKLPEANLVFYGITITPESVNQSQNPQYTNSTSTTYNKTLNPVELNYTKNIEFIDCTITGDNKFLTLKGINIGYSENIKVQQCEISTVSAAIVYLRSNKCYFYYNTVHETTSTFFQDGGYSKNIVVEGNYGYDQNYSYNDDYCPRAEGQNHHGSAVSIRGSNIVIRKNIFRDGGSSSGIMFYSSNAPSVFHNIVIENNLIYDIHNNSVLRILRPGKNILIRNNTIVGRSREDNTNGPYRYNIALAVESRAKGYSLKGLNIYNNILVGIMAFDVSTSGLNEGNNIVWAIRDSDYSFYTNSNWINGSTKVIKWEGETSDNYFQSGFFSGTLNTSWDSASGELNPEGHGTVLNLTLAGSSPAKGYGNEDMQSTTSLGTIVSGGVQINGDTRISDIGCYQE